MNRAELRTAGGGSAIGIHKQLFELRGREPALTSGELVWLDSDAADDVVAFLRSTATMKSWSP